MRPSGPAETTTTDKPKMEGSRNPSRPSPPQTSPSFPQTTPATKDAMPKPTIKTVRLAAAGAEKEVKARVEQLMAYKQVYGEPEPPPQPQTPRQTDGTLMMPPPPPAYVHPHQQASQAQRMPLATKTSTQAGPRTAPIAQMVPTAPPSQQTQQHFMPQYPTSPHIPLHLQIPPPQFPPFVMPQPPYTNNPPPQAPQQTPLPTPKPPAARKRRASRPLVQVVVNNEGYKACEGPDSVGRRKLSPVNDEEPPKTTTIRQHVNGEQHVQVKAPVMQTPVKTVNESGPKKQVPANTWDGTYKEPKEQAKVPEAPRHDSTYATRSPSPPPVNQRDNGNGDDERLSSQGTNTSYLPDLPDINDSFTPSPASIFDDFDEFGDFFNFNAAPQDDEFDFNSSPEPLTPTLQLVKPFVQGSHGSYTNQDSRSTSTDSLRNAMRATSFSKISDTLTEEPKAVFDVGSPTLRSDVMFSQYGLFDDFLNMPADPMMEGINSREVPTDFTDMMGWGRSNGLYATDSFDAFMGRVGPAEAKRIVSEAYAVSPFNSATVKQEREDPPLSSLSTPSARPTPTQATAPLPPKSTPVLQSIKTQQPAPQPQTLKAPRTPLPGLVIPHGSPITLFYHFTAHYGIIHDESRHHQEELLRQQGKNEKLPTYLDIVRDRNFSEDRFHYLVTVISETLKAFGARCHIPRPPPPVAASRLSNVSSMSDSSIASSSQAGSQDESDSNAVFINGVKGRPSPLASSQVLPQGAPVPQAQYRPAEQQPVVKAPISPYPLLPNPHQLQQSQYSQQPQQRYPSPQLPPTGDPSASQKAKRDRKKYTKRPPVRLSGGTLVWLSRLDEQIDHFLVERLYDLRDEGRIVGGVGERMVVFGSEEERFNQAQLWGAGEPQLYEIAERSNEGTALSPFMVNGKLKYPLWIAYWVWA
ncbi:hypothetical protein BJ508DRAFT_334418 [Ascobolus immersus RN42]|uniref:Uncharacterized protein n=1 Tax=Ascobolus immersus RN42 TaxID=1160509 RepID=A0A3N4HTT9_ASCIM|nr:hypothetical protein BJ508DRAFT_334418 [Ascobolus immersus RN42]